MDEYYQMVQSLPSWLARQLMDMPSALAPDVQELRLHTAGNSAGACLLAADASDAAADGGDLVHIVRWVGPHASDGDRTGVCDGSLRVPGGPWWALSAKPGTGRRFAGTDLRQPARCT